MEINRPINRRNALKVLGLGMLATCVPTPPACGNAKNEKKIKRLIFYFSATGNSLYVSRQIAGEEGTLLSISQEIHNENPVYEAEEIGFVCPVYCFIPPAIVQDFIARSTFKGRRRRRRGEGKPFRLASPCEDLEEEGTEIRFKNFRTTKRTEHLSFVP